jgi:hypothetical protein
MVIPTQMNAARGMAWFVQRLQPNKKKTVDKLKIITKNKRKTR